MVFALVASAVGGGSAVAGSRAGLFPDGPGEQAGDDEDLGPEEDLDNDDVIGRVQRFWSDHDTEAGFVYRPLPDRVISPVPPEPGEVAPTCGGVTVVPSDIADNAAVVQCPEGLIVVWDPDLIDGTLTDLFGEIGPAVVFAHEWGHVVQFQSRTIDAMSPVLIENQADCFAGAWVADAVADGYGPFDRPEALDTAIGAMIYFRDPVGSSPDTPYAHGSGFDRVQGFQDGYEHGVAFCAGYPATASPIQQLAFTDPGDVASGGDLEFVEAFDLITDDLDDYWDVVLDDYWDVVLDDFEPPAEPIFDRAPEDDLRNLARRLGDGSLAMVLGMLWAEAAQRSLGVELDGGGPFRQRTCLLGSWLGDVLDAGRGRRVTELSLSPGDLDEIIITFLDLTERDLREPGQAFEAVAEMRNGTLDGLEACALDR